MAWSERLERRKGKREKGNADLPLAPCFRVITDQASHSIPPFYPSPFSRFPFPVSHIPPLIASRRLHLQPVYRVGQMGDHEQVAVLQGGGFHQQPGGLVADPAAGFAQHFHVQGLQTAILDAIDLPAVVQGRVRQGHHALHRGARHFQGHQLAHPRGARGRSQGEEGIQAPGIRRAGGAHQPEGQGLATHPGAGLGLATPGQGGEKLVLLGGGQLGAHLQARDRVETDQALAGVDLVPHGDFHLGYQAGEGRGHPGAGGGQPGLVQIGLGLEQARLQLQQAGLVVGDGQLPGAQADVLARQVGAALLHGALGIEVFLPQLLETLHVGVGDGQQALFVFQLIQVRLVAQRLALDGGIQFQHLAARLVHLGVEVPGIQFQQHLARRHPLAFPHVHGQDAADTGRGGLGLVRAFHPAIQDQDRAGFLKRDGHGFHPPDRLLGRRRGRLGTGGLERQETADADGQQQHRQENLFLVHHGPTRKGMRHYPRGRPGLARRLSDLKEGSVRVTYGCRADDGGSCLPPFVKGDRGGFGPVSVRASLGEIPPLPPLERGEPYFLANSAHHSLTRTEPIGNRP
jgi:hypothetical protein